jgi:hypothetical protein
VWRFSVTALLYDPHFGLANSIIFPIFSKASFIETSRRVSMLLEQGIKTTLQVALILIMVRR